MEAFYFRLPFFFVLLLEMSYFRSISAFSFQRYNGAGISRSSRNGGAWPYTAMNLVRGTAANSKFEAWYQKTIESLSLCEPLISIPLDEEFSSSLGLIGKSNVTFKSKAWQSKSLRYIRLISFVGEGYDVFNFLAIPRSTISLPILGIDVVSLPRGSLAAIDFQPHSADPSVFDSELYTCLKGIHDKYSLLLPTGGEMQEETSKYFSPYATWTRISGSEGATSAIADSNDNSNNGDGQVDLMSVVGEAVDEYVTAYSKLLSTHTHSSTSTESGSSSSPHTTISEEFLADYLSYRTAKDPAKRLLVGAFGADWTQRVLSEVMFPHTPILESKGSGSSCNDNLKEVTLKVVDHPVVGERTGGEEVARNIPSVITFVTGNAKKKMEVEDILRLYDTSFELISQNTDLPELQGEPVDIAVEKCRIAANSLGCPVITEDTSLCFHALQGLPGPYIKWFIEKIGHEGLNNLLIAYPDKSAYAQCIVAYCEGPGHEVKTFVGRTEGHIVPAAFLPPGDGPAVPAFGWDPIFRPIGFEGTYAQIPKEVKNKISHRYKAFAQLAHYLGGKAVDDK